MWRLGVFFGSIALLIQGAFPPWHSGNSYQVSYEWAFTNGFPGEIYCGRLLCQAMLTIGATALIVICMEDLDRKTLPNKGAAAQTQGEPRNKEG